jgi:hypothetical protein
MSAVPRFWRAAPKQTFVRPLSLSPESTYVSCLPRPSGRVARHRPAKKLASWRRLKGENQLPKVVQGVTFRNGVEVNKTPAQNAA